MNCNYIYKNKIILSHLVKNDNITKLFYKTIVFIELFHKNKNIRV